MLQHTENTFWAVGTVQLIECLPIKYETQGSIPCTAPLKQGMVVCITPDFRSRDKWFTKVQVVFIYKGMLGQPGLHGICLHTLMTLALKKKKSRTHSPAQQSLVLKY